MSFLDSVSNAWNSIANRFERVPSTKTIPTSGIIYSDYYRNSAGLPSIAVGRGWIKGWLMDTDRRDVIVVTRHAGPGTTAPMNKVFVVDKRGTRITRRIVEVIPVDIPGYPADQNLGDICVCRLDAAMPDTVTAYKIGKSERGKKSFVLTDRGWSTALLSPSTNSMPSVRGLRRNRELIAGDSGLPWFVWEKKSWRVVTHTHRGMWGEGPNYSHPQVWPVMLEAVKRLRESSSVTA